MEDLSGSADLSELKPDCVPLQWYGLTDAIPAKLVTIIPRLVSNLNNGNGIGEISKVLSSQSVGMKASDIIGIQMDAEMTTTDMILVTASYFHRHIACDMQYSLAKRLEKEPTLLDQCKVENIHTYSSFTY